MCCGIFQCRTCPMTYDQTFDYQVSLVGGGTGVKFRLEIFTMPLDI